MTRRHLGLLFLAVAVAVVLWPVRYTQLKGDFTPPERRSVRCPFPAAFATDEPPCAERGRARLLVAGVLVLAAVPLGRRAWR